MSQIKSIHASLVMWVFLILANVINIIRICVCTPGTEDNMVMFILWAMFMSCWMVFFALWVVLFSLEYKQYKEHKKELEKLKLSDEFNEDD